MTVFKKRHPAGLMEFVVNNEFFLPRLQKFSNVSVHYQRTREHRTHAKKKKKRRKDNRENTPNFQDDLHHYRDMENMKCSDDDFVIKSKYTTTDKYPI